MNYERIIQELGVKIANVEVENAQLRVDNQSLSKKVIEQQEQLDKDTEAKADKKSAKTKGAK